MARKVKVLHFPIQKGLGGVRSYVIQNWLHMDHKEVQFDLITRFEPDEGLKREVGLDGNIYPVTGAYAGNEQMFLEKVSKIMDNGYDILHLHTSNWFGGFPIEELAVKKKIPRIIVHAHNSGLDPCYVKEDYDRLLARHILYKSQFNASLATDFFACSQTAADWIFPHNIPRENIKILKNAIDTQKYRFCVRTREKARAELGITDNFVIGHVGRFAQQKNHVFLLKIFRAILEKKPNARLVLIGDGPLFEEIRHEVADIGNNVLFLGTQKDVPSLMQAFDCFLLPSLFEGLPFVLIEAQTAGLPCLTSIAVSPEIEITNRIVRFPLEEKAQVWAEKLISMTERAERKDLSQEVVAAGYDLREAARVLEKFYLGKGY